MRIAVVDDEDSSAQKLGEYLQRYKSFRCNKGYLES